ncbi:MAG: tetratricopeptide repeat protein [Chloroflexi bacterium]|nr:tetratricopeptide repeat protein [Chloroflexota bacterium]
MQNLDWRLIVAIPGAIVAIGLIARWLWWLFHRKPTDPPSEGAGGPSATATASPTINVNPNINVNVNTPGGSAPAESKPPNPPHNSPSATLTGSGLPYGNPHFVGRDAEKTQVIEHVLHGRSVLLHGEPGIGKTELAIQALRSPEIQRAFKDHLYWFETTPDSLPALCDQVARHINAQAVTAISDLDDKIQAPRANLVDSLPLLAFNNADGPAAAAVDAFCQHVVPAPILATSRNPVPGLERIDPKPLEEPYALTLFASYSRQPSDTELPTIKEVLRFLDYNPLAVILAAPNFGPMSAADLLRQLQSRPFDVLQDPNRSVRAAFDLSYRRLPRIQQRLFAALSLFAGPDFSAEAIQSLFDEGIGLEMGNLVGVSLLRRDQATGRYSLHPLLKQYASGKLENADALQLRLAAYYARFTGAHDQPSEQDLNAVALDFPNIRGSMEWCLARPKEQSAALLLTELVTNLYHFLLVRGYWVERIAWGETAVEAAKAIGDDQRLATIMQNLGIANQDQGRTEEAADLYQQSLEIAKRLGDRQGIAVTLHQLGILAQHQGRTEEARDLYQQSLDIKKRLGDQQGIATTLHNLGAIAQDQGRLEEARDLYQQSLDTRKRLGDQQGIAKSLHSLGILAQDQGRPEEARDLYQQSLDIKKRLGDQQGIAATVHQLGRLAQDQGRPEEAAGLYQQSLDIAKRLGDQRGVAISLHQLGRLAEDGGNLELARSHFSQALETLERLGSPDAETARESLQRVQEQLKAKAPDP